MPLFAQFAGVDPSQRD